MRSSHEAPTPRGGGLAIYLVLIAGWTTIITASPNPPVEIGWILLCSLGLAIPSGVDDVRGLSIIARLLWQVVIATTGTFLLSGPLPVFQGLLPPTADTLATVFLWVGFINLFNFTDGIDGNAGTKAMALGLGMFALSILGATPTVFGELGIITAAVAVGFLVWNWHPASIFMGDVGSVPLGFLLGWLLLRTASEGQWAPALILPLVYLTDSGLTYAARIAGREQFWRPHRDHYYQRAALREGVTHADVVKVILLGDVALIGMAILATQGLIALSLFGAAATSAAVIAYLSFGLGQRDV